MYTLSIIVQNNETDLKLLLLEKQFCKKILLLNAEVVSYKWNDFSIV